MIAIQEISKLTGISVRTLRYYENSLEWMGFLGQLKQIRSYGAKSAQVQRIIKRMMEKSIEGYQYHESFLEKMWEIRKSPHFLRKSDYIH